MAVRRQRGITLVEIMIAVAILAIVATIAIPIYEGYIVEARYGTAVKDMRQMELIFDDLASDNDLRAVDGNSTAVRGVYTDATGNVALGNVGVCPPASMTPPVPWCDPWNNNYRYQRPVNTSQTYALFSAGPDGTAGNADDASK